MSIDKVDGGVADMVRREMETRRTEMLEEEQRARVALDSAAQAAQEIAAEGKVGDGSDLVKAAEAGATNSTMIGSTPPRPIAKIRSLSACLRATTNPISCCR